MALGIIQPKVLWNSDASKEKLQSAFTNRFTCLSLSREKGANKLFYTDSVLEAVKEAGQ